MYKIKKDVENDTFVVIVPPNLRINYHTVNSIINAKFNNLSKKKRNPVDSESERLWIQHLQQRNYVTLFTVKPFNGPRETSAFVDSVFLNENTHR